MRQLSTTQLFARSPINIHPKGNGGENLKNVKLVGCDEDDIIGQLNRTEKQWTIIMIIIIV